jgi:hypothetical protein
MVGQGSILDQLPTRVVFSPQRGLDYCHKPRGQDPRENPAIHGTEWAIPMRLGSNDAAKRVHIDCFMWEAAT